MGGPGGLPSMGSHRVRHDWSDLAAAAALEKAMATQCSVLAWRIPGTGEPGGLPSKGSHRVGHDWETSLSLSCIGEGNDNPLQCSCLENPRDRGAWWEAVYGVAQSQTRLKWLNSNSSIICSILYILLMSAGSVVISSYLSDTDDLRLWKNCFCQPYSGDLSLLIMFLSN